METLDNSLSRVCHKENGYQLPSASSRRKLRRNTLSFQQRSCIPGKISNSSGDKVLIRRLLMRITRTSERVWGGGYLIQAEKKKPQTFVRNCVALFDTASEKMAEKGVLMKVHIISMNLLP